MRFFKWLAVGLFLVVALIIGAFVMMLRPLEGNSDKKVDFVITRGVSKVELAQKLQEQGLIKNAFAFSLYLKLIRGPVISGVYEISPSQSASEIADRIASGKFKTARLVIIEGWRVLDMVKLFEEKKLINVADFQEKASPYEGYLFPDTYEVKIDITSDELIDMMRKNFEKRTKSLSLTREDVILASIVEREAKTDEERPKIAAVYQNRLKSGMKLEADPTVQYAKGNWKAPTVEDYRSVISPYNTYLNEGLPPGPICSAGLKSLEAVKNPDSHDFYYFFHAKGQIYFSKTYAEHAAKVRQYF